MVRRMVTRSCVPTTNGQSVGQKDPPDEARGHGRKAAKEIFYGLKVVNNSSAHDTSLSHSNINHLGICMKFRT